MRSVEAVRQIPGVRSAGISTYTPLSGRDRGAMVRIRGYEPSSPEDATVHTNQVSDGYFESMGIALVRGRLLTDQDTDGTPKVAVINETGARKFFGRRDPVGEMVTFTRKGEDSSYRIVGVVQDTRHMSLREAPQRFVFVPLRQPRDVDRRVTLVVASRTPGRTLDLLAPVRRSLAGVEPGILVSDVTTMQNQLKNTLVTERLLSGLSNVFGALAMIVAGIGLYGVLSYRVGRQRNGIAIRMALGASPASVGIGVLRQSGLAIAFGLCAGLPFAVMGARLAQNMIWGVKAGDFRVYAGCVAALCLVGLLSAGLPARRAATIQPLEALRHD
jgi:predicted permease